VIIAHLYSFSSNTARCFIRSKSSGGTKLSMISHLKQTKHYLPIN
jgi:hypothetical protein